MIKAKMKEKGITVVQAAKQLSIHRNSLHRKLVGSRKWTYKEIGKMARMLEMTRSAFVQEMRKDIETYENSQK